MNAPLYSTITLFAEILISSAIYYTLYQGYKNNHFPAVLAWLAVSYEIIFNISYMTLRALNHSESSIQPALNTALAIAHGLLSLIMFISLIIFFFIAWRKYRNGINYFKEQNILTAVFTAFWTVSVLSGILFYFVEYII